jgi:hypoxanthine phosphoribosyltransferase
MKQVTIEDKTFGIYIQDQEIQLAIQNIANQMNVLYADKKPIFISVLNGAFMFTTDLLKKIEVPCELSFIKLSSYSGKRLLTFPPKYPLPCHS